jgi:hypothetical protein
MIPVNVIPTGAGLLGALPRVCALAAEDVAARITNKAALLDIIKYLL